LAREDGEVKNRNASSGERSRGNPVGTRGKRRPQPERGIRGEESPGFAEGKKRYSGKKERRGFPSHWPVKKRKRSWSTKRGMKLVRKRAYLDAARSGRRRFEFKKKCWDSMKAVSDARRDT